MTALATFSFGSGVYYTFSSPQSSLILLRQMLVSSAADSSETEAVAIKCTDRKSQVEVSWDEEVADEVRLCAGE